MTDDTVDLMTLASCGSLVFCSFMLIHMWANRQSLKKSPQRLMVWWAVTEVIKVLNRLPVRTYFHPGLQKMCTVAGWLDTSLNLTTLCWALAMTTNLVLIAVFHFTAANVLSLEKFYVAIALLVPPLAASAPLILGVDDHAPAPFYGPVGIGCWITPHFRPYRLYLELIPKCSTLGYIVVCSVGCGVAIFTRVRRNSAPPKAVHGVMVRYVYRAAIQIATFCLGYMPLSILQICYLRSMVKPSYAMLAWMVLSVGGQGVLTAFGYFSPHIFHAIVKYRERSASEDLELKSARKLNKTFDNKVGPAQSVNF
ncbi:hypothetical protein RI367_002241 [Sorochytrium milnesiophthora]